MVKWLIFLTYITTVVFACDECDPCICHLVDTPKTMCIVNCSYHNLSYIPFTIPTYVEYLELSYNQLEGDDLNTLQNFTEYLETLNLSHNKLTYIPPASLSTASILQDLSLDGNILTYVNSSSFGYLKQLRKLLGLRSLQFSNDTFENMKGLDELSIIFDSEQISENIFDSLKLKHLSIEFKSATVIPKTLFHFGVDTLLDIQLDAPTAESLHEDTFSGLTILRSVIIKAGSMHTLPSFLFHSIDGDNRMMPVNLVTVKIDGVKSLPRNLFDKQQSLKYLALNNIEDLLLSKSESQIETLDLSGSPLYRIKSGWFSSFKSLRFLNLSRTHLTEIYNDTFSTLSSLTDLDLSFNKIKQLPKGLFKASRNTLVALNVSYNQIQNVSRNTFEAVKSLEKLNLGQNKISFIDENAFIDLFMLTELLLDDNHLRFLSSDTLIDQTSLTDLQMARNNLTQLPRNLFRNARSLRRLDISGNKIETLPHDFFENVRHLEFVSLGDNPVHCDCSLMFLRDSLPRVHLFGRCKAPPYLFGKHLADLKINASCLVKITPTSSSSFFTSSMMMSKTSELSTFPTTIKSTSYDQATKTYHIESTSAKHLYPTVINTFDSDMTEEAKNNNNFYSSFIGSSAFYVALGCVAAVCGGATLTFLIFRARRKLRSRAYEVNETNEVQIQ